MNKNSNNNPFESNGQTSGSFETTKPKKSGKKITIITIVSIVSVIVIAIGLRIGLMAVAADKLDVSMGGLQDAEILIQEVLGVSDIDMIKSEYYIATDNNEELENLFMSYLSIDPTETKSDVNSEVQSDVESESDVLDSE